MNGSLTRPERDDIEHDLERDAERSVLAAMMLDEQAIGRAAELIDAAAFYRTSHANLFNALVALYNARVPADLITVAEELRRRGDLEAVGGPPFLAEVLELATTAANLEQHCRIVREHANRRALVRLGIQLQDRAADGSVTAEELCAFAQAGLAAVPVDGATAALGRRIQFLDLAALREHGIPPVRWIVDGWLAEGDVALVSGDGGIGKSTTVAALAMAVATGQPWCGISVGGAGLVLVFDEEQNESEVARLYTRLGAPHDSLRVACQQGVNLTTGAGISRLERELSEYRPRLVVLDSVQQVFLGVDGANADAVAKVYGELFRLRRLYGTTFIMIGHLRKPPPQGQLAPLHLVHGSVAFGTQASTVWVATSPAHSLLELGQAKRRGADRTSLRIRYESAGPDAAIVLTGEGPVEAQETAAERTQDFVVRYLAERGASTTAWIVKAAAEQTPPIAKRVVERALKHLRSIGRVEQPMRGYYELVKTAEAP
jgi:hypothetical protein